jgi:glycosyltransferase involved in cell wall biosynthesis
MIAIVIPFFKIKYFERVLESLSAQTQKDFQVYIGNDNSPSDPQTIINRFEDSLSIAYKKFDDNLGSTSLIKQWNRCINLIEKENWVVLLGDDDVVSSNYIEVLLKKIKSSNLLICSVFRFSTIVIDENDKALSKVNKNPENESSVSSLYRKIRGEGRSSLSEYVFYKKVDVPLFTLDLPLGWHSDDLAVLENSNYGSVCAINSSIVFIRNSKQSISGSKKFNVEKNKATFMFYYFLLTKRKCKFNANQKQILISKLEKSALNNRANIGLSVKLAGLFLFNGSVLRLSSFFNSYISK